MNNYFNFQFLEHCTAMLNLPFAARRLFDDQGHEHFTIRDTLQRDQLVYISCGESWTDPKLTKAEQQRRFLLANLSADIAQIRQFVALRKPEGLLNLITRYMSFFVADLHPSFSFIVVYKIILVF
jgi:hypothetical protein